MPCNVYCPFCGVILLPDPYCDDPESLQIRIRPWYAEVRGIYLTNAAFLHIAITGLGIIRDRNVHAPLDKDLSYIDVGTDVLEEWGLCEPSESRWCFGFHNSCWRLLLLRLGQGNDDRFQNETAIAESIFSQLYCTPCLYASSFAFGHDYQGAAHTHKYFGRPKAVDLSSHFYADPCAIPPLDSLTVTSPQEGASLRAATVLDIDYPDERRSCESSPFGSNGDQHLIPRPDEMKDKRHPIPGKIMNDFFDALSPELKYEIFSYLSFDQLLNMRLVCRNLALLASLDRLPQSYWRSRFLLGQEADFLFPTLTDKLDWSQPFFWTRTSLRAECLNLINRKRIRQLLEPIAALVDRKAAFQNGPHGSTFQPVQMQDKHCELIDGETTGKPPQLMQLTGLFSGQLVPIGADSPLNEGCRIVYNRTRPFMALREDHGQRIGISTVQFGARSFISGINLSPPGHNADHVVGYPLPASENWKEIPSSSHLRAIRVAFCSEGLRGIQLIFTDSDSSGWVGDSNGPGIAQGILTIDERLDSYFLLAGLDFFKIVSLALGKLTSHGGDSVNVPSQCVIDSSSIQSHLWIPRPPKHEDLMISALLPSRPPRAFEPLIDIDFGGSRGLLLGSLTRLTFHMASSPYPVIGVEIFYSDGKSELFGSSGGCELSFFVNGSDGERINQVGILEDGRRYHRPIGLGGLQVSTNYGRCATFAPLSSRLDTSVELLPSPPLGNTMTGFVALDEENGRHFIRLGVQSQPCDEEPMILPDSVNHECHLIPDDQLSYDEKFTHFINSSNPGNYQTYASLRNVRKIQASIGIQGRSRSPNCISGLKFNYYDHPSPGVVGQWMNELNDGFELSPNEKVQSLTIWLTPVGVSTECRGIETGQVTAIHINTTSSRSVTFQSPGFHPLPSERLLHQYQSDTGEEIIAISWILNASCDCVRAVISSSGNRKTEMIPEQEPPFDQVQKLYFETNSEDGFIEAIVAAEAYFRNRAIVGLTFVYSSDRRVSVGDCNVPAYDTVRFEQGAQIVGLSVAVADQELMEIEFEVELNERSCSEKLRLSIALADDPGSGIGYDWRDVWCKDESSAEAYERVASRDMIYKPPIESRLVGIYVGSQSFFCFGALYAPKLSQQS